MFGNRMTLCTLAAMAAVLGVATEAKAVALVDVNWDGSGPTAAYAYNYKSAGGTLTTVASVATGGGAGGTNGYVAVTDSTLAPQGSGTYWGAAATIEHNTLFDLSGAVNGATDLTYSIDVSLSGYVASRTTVSLRMEISFIDAGVTLYRGRVSPLWQVATGGFQTFSGDFTTLAAQGGTLLQTALDANKPLRVKFATEIPSGSQFGYDAENVLAIDNVQVFAPAPVPEPTSLALIAIGAMGLMRRRA